MIDDSLVFARLIRVARNRERYETRTAQLAYKFQRQREEWEERDKEVHGDYEHGYESIGDLVEIGPVYDADTIRISAWAKGSESHQPDTTVHLRAEDWLQLVSRLLEVSPYPDLERMFNDTRLQILELASEIRRSRWEEEWEEEQQRALRRGGSAKAGSRTAASLATRQAYYHRCAEKARAKLPEG